MLVNLDVFGEFPMRLQRSILLASLLLFGVAKVTQATLPDAQQIGAMRQQMGQSDDRSFQKFFQQHNIVRDRLPDAKMRAVLDELCQQRDCHASQLYWHTDLEQAKTAAQKAGKPILSLRMLGNLDEEMSCANSRFFRVALYANTEISQKLRDRFILHWSSERPVPKMTIDFGDGRKLERTVTGNSIHYVLDPQGQPIEALPGLYSPQAFLTQLNQVDTAFQAYQKASEVAKPDFWQNYYRDRLAQLQTKWGKELQQVGLPQAPKLLDMVATDAATAGRVALSKSVVELPIVRQLRSANRNQQELSKMTDEASWQKLAARVESRLDANSLALMKAKVDPNASADFAKTVKQFEQNMALDTVRNEYLLHGQLYQWFLAGNETRELGTLNQRVYAEMFLTPQSDPWLGLNPSEAFAAIEQDGRVR
jgi:hypothetical protein